ncbi:Acyl-CoA dehydrogenase [Rubrobacter radiotolerans]|uniref:Acyl-CoA dehydrogenase n=1 Tax=Rubrobacter radiotolerans TaxID=42256 RepID=A0A023X4I6_RUBRA|nr:acyl-CoA dehydrogenase family protein [Rubrobacter radiotolerans]AHY47387.1 Acyl-CoA dehydrogenase [Rubrobacter radiotolerans]MDX5894790.1 acyl-CoA dehydrogenase family protein [Rubrobacter radiotolerans]SMC06769.1 acyl-CoA dehydrogenase [Rubrobacter radiotolerans DSM 5868]
MDLTDPPAEALASATADTERLRKTARDFARETVAPAAARHDRDRTFPHEIVERARELGLVNLLSPVAHGGEGLGPVELCVVAEELAWGCVGIGAAALLNNLAADCLALAGSERQKQEYFPRLCQTGGFASYSVTEPGAGSNVAGLTTRAERRGGGGYRLSGSKLWVGHATEADFMVVFAKTDPEARHRGVSAFLVDRDRPGVDVVRPLPKLGQRAFSSCEVELRDVELPGSALLGREGEGFTLAMRVFDRSRPMVAAFALGLARRALDESLAYATEREAFGRPIVEFQGVGFKLAEMGMRVEAARLLTYSAAAKAARGERNSLEAAYAKTFASDTAMFAATEAVQVFGGRGYSEDYPVEKLFRDAKALQIYEGANEVQRQIMVRELTQSSRKRAEERMEEGAE